jgi:glycosyltransferase involved in cell wall biosynthesis
MKEKIKNIYLKILKLYILLFPFLVYSLFEKNESIIFEKIKIFEDKISHNKSEIKDFRNINSENILIDKRKYNRTNYPEISIIMSVYNQADFLHKSLRSIQNQSLKNLEIIIVDDYSSDNSLELLENYQKEDDRIVIIKHDKNKGKIKTRTDGIKLAKGKYITILDGDDAFIYEDILYNSLYIAKIGNLDIVEFKLSEFRNENFTLTYNDFSIKKILYQPELSQRFIKLNRKDSYFAIINRSICAKLIKRNIFINIINYIGPKYTEEHLLIYEDTIMALSLYRIAKSYYLMKEEGYYYSRNDYQNKMPPKKDYEISIVKFLEFLFEKTKNKRKDIQIVYYEIISLNYFYNFNIYINNQIEKIFILLDKIVKNRSLSKKQKKIIIKLILEMKSKKINK